MVHAEIYKDPERALSSSATATTGSGADLGEVTEAVTAYELPFEPVLYAAGSDGVIRARLDSIYDGTELGAVLPTRRSAEADAAAARQLKLWPQPQDLVAFGLSMLNPACCSPSL